MHSPELANTHVSLHMLMRIQMLLAILIIPIALRAEPELEIWIIAFRLAADRTLMLRDRLGLLHLMLELRAALYL